MWFMIIYLIGAYIRNYQEKLFANQKLWFLLCLCSVVLCLLSVVACVFAHSRWGIDIGVYYFVADSNKILAVFTAVSAFITFKNIKLKYNKTINTIASATFGVLLIHANSDAMRS
jgi:hypothetical protein